ncbi:hypothetical protein FG379_002429 [Cryptosporidium bovis]|uniref:uncharacterized protein n=1 Tax=Cryptosporidium bovis TaxID=310047 RepID=UPI003519F505|nr:hypothetical protein FG379_002429 [Cryptosporidium bovis]
MNRELRTDFVKKNMELINKAGERIKKYKSILLLCSVLFSTFECRINIKEKAFNDIEESSNMSTIEELSNIQFTVTTKLKGDDTNRLYDMKWRVFNGKYGSVTFANVRIPIATEELFIKSHILSSYSGMPIKTKGIRAWFHGNSAISPGWVSGKINMYLAIKSPFAGVHSHGDELWERENKMNLLLSREFFGSKRMGFVSTEEAGSESDTMNYLKISRRYQISPAMITFHSNSDLNGNSSPKHFYLTRDLRRKVKMNEQNRPIFSNYMFMEYIDGFPLEILLYYLRSDEMNKWLSNVDERWNLWLLSILNLVILVLNAVQSFSSSGYMLYMHCDLNFGNILVSRENERGGNNTKRLLEDKNDHWTNLKRIATMGHESVRIIDFSFSYILNNKDTYTEQRELFEFIKKNGVERVIGERNFENICKQTLKSALFNDPNYVSIIILEILKGYSVLFNKNRIESKEQVISFEMDEKWNDTDNRNKYLNAINELILNLDDTQEWNTIAMKFVQHEEPIKRWVNKNNSKKSLSTFNQGVEAYMKVCDVVTNSVNSLHQENKLGQAGSEGKKSYDYHFSLKDEFSPNYFANACFSIETYIRGYLFLPFSFSRIGSCIFDNVQTISGLKELLSIHESYSYFQLTSLIVDFITWLYVSQNAKNSFNEIQPTLEFYHTLRSRCVTLNNKNYSFLDDESLIGDSHLNGKSSDFLTNSNIQTVSMGDIGSIDEKLEKTVEIYKEMNKNQMGFILKNIVERKIPVPISLLVQRTWYRIQELPELITKKVNSDELLSVIFNLFETLNSYSKLHNYYDKNAEYTKFLLISDKLLLEDCIIASNNGNLNYISDNALFKDTFLSDPIKLCQFIIKPIHNKITFW